MDQTCDPSAHGKDGSGLGLCDDPLEADGVRKQVAVLSSDHVAGSCCSLSGELCCGVFGESAASEVLHKSS